MEQVGHNEFERTNPKPLIKLFFKTLKGKWQYGYEKGKNGYEHIQARIEYGYKDDRTTFDKLQERLVSFLGCRAHVEAAETKSWSYERKDGKYITSEDNHSRWICRFAPLRAWQVRVLQMANRQSTREVHVFINCSGGIGKSHLLQWLWEHDKAVLVPRHKQTTSEICQSIHNKYHGQTYIVFDLQRQRILNEEMAESIEIVKDGIIEDVRYHSDEKNIRGTKVIVFTNNYIPYKVLKSLSQDRWKIYTIEPNARAFEVTITPVLLHSSSMVDKKRCAEPKGIETAVLNT